MGCDVYESTTVCVVSRVIWLCVFCVGSTASAGELGDRLAAQLRRGFSRCEGATVKQRDAVVELTVPRFCTFPGGRGLSGSVTFSELDGAPPDAPVRHRLRLVVTAKALVFDSQQFDGVLLEGTVNDEGALSIVQREPRAKVKPAPPRPGPRVIETREPPRDRRMDPIGEAAKDVGRTVAALPYLVPALVKAFGKELDAAAFAQNPALVATWLLLVDGGTP